MKPPLKRLLALVGAILLAGLAIATLLVAIFLPGSQILAGLAVAIIGLPILLWLAFYMFKGNDKPPSEKTH
jgi:ABC-type Fe3+-siderophore transport system permease subunit